MNVTNSTLPVLVEEHTIDAATVVWDLVCSLAGWLLVALHALVIRKIANRYFVSNMTHSEDESEENDPSRRQPRGSTGASGECFTAVHHPAE